MSAAPPTGHTAPTLRALFDVVADMPAHERAAYLADAAIPEDLRAQLERMLAADASGSGALAADPVPGLIAAIGDAPRPRLPPGTRVGAFELLEPLGEGGFATVFRAFRDSNGVRQQVALKLLHRGMHSPDAQRQFRREHQVLAQLQHPNIARLIEGGITAEGLAFIALELVDGVPITTFVQAHGLDERARLRLFVQACRAAEAAHRALIVHRDLKPSNVLVTADGEVKLLDFGIAKLLQEDDADVARTLVPAFTRAYAAPEQMDGGLVTAATDVHALGVLLGEILTGERGGPARGNRDLARIRAMATAPEAAQRYASAGHLADDIERLLQGHPVLAHPPSRRYRLRKFVRRHRAGVALAAVLVAGLLATSAVALRQAGLAQREAQRANTVRDFLVSVFDGARAHLPRDLRPTPEQLVEEARQRLAASTMDPHTRAEVLRTLGEVDLSLSNFGRAASGFADAIALLADAPEAQRTVRVLHADALQQGGDNAGARTALEPLLEPLRRQAGAPLLRALAVLANAAMAGGRPELALAYRREAAAAARRAGATPLELLAAELEVGSTLAEMQDHREAARVLDPLLARWRALEAPADARYLAALHSRASVAYALGDSADAIARQRELLRLKRGIYSAPHDSIARSLRNLGIVLMHASAEEEAHALLAEALAMQRAVYGPDHEQLAITLDAIGLAYVRQKDFAAADASYRHALAVCDRTQIRTEACARARNNLGQSLYRQDQLPEARAQMELALGERRQLLGDQHPTVAYSLSTLSNVAAAQGDHAAAVALAAEALAILERGGLGESREAALTRNSHAQALAAAGRNADALREIDLSLADWQRVAPDDRVRHAMMLALKARILHDLGRPADATRIARSANALLTPSDPLPARTRALLDSFDRTESLRRE